MPSTTELGKVIRWLWLLPLALYFFELPVTFMLIAFAVLFLYQLAERREERLWREYNRDIDLY